MRRVKQLVLWAKTSGSKAKRSPEEGVSPLGKGHFVHLPVGLRISMQLRVGRDRTLQAERFIWASPCPVAGKVRSLGTLVLPN